jgi:shikimate kinase
MTPAPQAGSAGPAAILVGPPGSGKSTVGPLLAGLLGAAFTDTDTLVEEQAGKPVSDIFIEDGEEAFRAIERAVVQAALRDGADRPGVIALSSGAILDPATARLLAGQPVVYLETGFAAVARRSGLAGPHPPLPGNPRGKLRQLLEERRPRYAAAAWLTVPTDASEPPDIAGQIAAALAARGPGQPSEPGRPGEARQPDGPGGVS